MRHPVYRGSDGLLHGSTTRTDGWLRIACETRGSRNFTVEKDPAPSGTAVTCVPCLAALMECG